MDNRCRDSRMAGALIRAPVIMAPHRHHRVMRLPPEAIRCPASCGSRYLAVHPFLDRRIHPHHISLDKAEERCQ